MLFRLQRLHLNEKRYRGCFKRGYTERHQYEDISNFIRVLADEQHNGYTYTTHQSSSFLSFDREAREEVSGYTKVA